MEVFGGGEILTRNFLSGRINNRHEELEVFEMMLYDEKKIVKMTEENPALIFELVKKGYYETIDKILSRKKVSINTTDSAGNDIIVRLLKVKQYDLVLKYMKKKEWDVNHQNKDGNTFAHILVATNYVNIMGIIKELKKNKNFSPNMKNNKGETILDKSINENYLYTTIKVLEDKRFNNIDLTSFKKLYDTYIKSAYYGKYSKLNNLEIIIDNLEKKEGLLPSIKELLKLMKENMELIKKEILESKTTNIEVMINLVSKEAVE